MDTDSLSALSLEATYCTVALRGSRIHGAGLSSSEHGQKGTYSLFFKVAVHLACPRACTVSVSLPTPKPQQLRQRSQNLASSGLFSHM